MKELSEIVTQLHKINETIIQKDNAINAYKKINNLLLKMLNDKDVKDSNNYGLLKMKYYDDFSKYLENINNENFNFVIEPEKKILIKPLNQKEVIINDFKFDEYAPNNLLKQQYNKLKTHNKTKILNIKCYCLIINENKYLCDFSTKIIYSFDKERIGHIDNDKIYINNVEIKLERIENMNELKKINNYKKMNSDIIHIIN